MQIYYQLEQLPQFSVPPVVSAGNFDGVHLGHQALITTMAERARALSCPSLVITFHPHPLLLLRPDKAFRMICTPAQRFALLERYGAQMVLCLNFDQKLADLSAHDFIRSILVERLQVREMVEGYDFNFGKYGRGNVDFLRQMGEKYNYIVHQLEPVIIGSEPVSSSRIRRAVAAGELALAARLLGHAFQLAGTVMAGEGRGGPLLNTPTANLSTQPNQLLPPQGVYVAKAQLADGARLPAIFNLGVNPTFNGLSAPRIEVHILDFVGNLYGQNILLEPLAFLRPECKFGSAAELKEQLARDIERTRQYMANES